MDLARQLETIDVHLSAEHGRLRVDAPAGALTPELREELARRKGDLIAWLEETAALPSAIEPIAPGAPVPLSFAQERIWFLEQFTPGTPAYTIVDGWLFDGPRDHDLLTRAWHELVRRHTSLRSIFPARHGLPHVEVLAHVSVSVRLDDLSALAPEAREREWQRMARAQAAVPFDLTSAPLFRASHVRWTPDRDALLLSIHHIISDEWSIRIIQRELDDLCRALAHGGSSTLAPITLQYGDLAQWQREWLQGDVLKAERQHWRRALEGAPAVLELPADRPRPRQPSGRGSAVAIELPATRLAGMKRLCRDERATSFMLVSALFAALLQRYTGQDDLLIGTPVSGRSRRETDGIVGLFINTVALRATFEPGLSLRGLLRQVRARTLDAFEHDALPFDYVVTDMLTERDSGRPPLVQVMCVFTADDGDVEALPVPGTGTAKFDLTLFVRETPAGLHGSIEYNADLFDESTMGRLAGHFAQLFERAVAAPDEPLSRVPMIDAAERRQVLEIWNSSEPAPVSRALHQLVEAQAGRTPGAAAVVTADGGTLTYDELNQRANRLAHRLIARGIGPDALVGVCLARGTDTIVALLAVLKAGGAYVPLDPAYPVDRRATILEDAHASIVVTQRTLAADMEGGGREILCLDAMADELADAPTGNPDAAVTPAHLAYVLFTSGSTGRPKGVAIEHRSAAAFVGWAHRVFTPEDLAGVLFATSVCFDLSIFEVFVPLAAGGAVVVVPHALEIGSVAASVPVTLLNTVPSIMAELLRMNVVPASVRTINLAGEALPAALVDQIAAGTRAATIYNLYGPTETTTYSTFTRVRPGEPITIGRPIDGTRAYVLDAERQPTPVGVMGELYLAGAGVARGYYGRPDLTSERFLPDPFASGDTPDARMYRTGDRCRWRSDGVLEYFGRLDHQVKIRGLRIELGEIEAVLARQAGVHRCVVVARQEATGGRLVAYVEPVDGAAPSVDAWRAHLAKALPEYMVPSAFVSMGRLPLTPNGKIDRNRLPAPPREAAPIARDQSPCAANDEIDREAPSVPAVEGASAVLADEPLTPTEQRLAARWASLLGVARVGRGDSFFALGGHSLLAMRLMHDVHEEFGVALAPGVLFEHPVLRDLAREVDTAGDATDEPVLVPIAEGGAGTPFYWMHGIGGEVFSYLDVSRHMAAERPVYGFAADWTRIGGDEAPTLERMAAFYVRRLKALQPAGPYHVGGFCAAALLALEMARQLGEQGDEVGLIAALDYNVLRGDAGGLERAGGLTSFVRNLPRWIVDDARRSGATELLGRVRSRWQRRRAHRTSPPGIGIPSAATDASRDIRDELGMWRFPDHQLPMLRAHYHAATIYEPRPVRGRVLLCLPRTAPLLGPWPAGYDRDWDRIAPEGVDVVSVRGSHSTMLGDPFAEGLAAVINRGVNDAEKRRSAQSEAAGR
jgi:amino acid adenylation domain-containing protein